MRTRQLAVLMLLITVLLLMAPAGHVRAADITDNIKVYKIEVTPQANGDLQMKYSFNWCFLTAYTGSEIYLELGVPNRDFDLAEKSGDNVSNARPSNSNGKSYVRVDFNKEFAANECTAFSFTIVQRGMAHLKGEEISFQLIPGWYDSARIDLLEVDWDLPDAALVKLLEPEPVAKNGNTAIWQKTNLGAGEKYTINLLVAREAYPDMVEQKPVENPPASGNESGSGGGIPGWVWLLIIVVIVVVVVVIVVAVNSDSDYSDGSTLGDYRPTYTGSYSPKSDDDDEDTTYHRPTTTYRPSCATASRPSYTPSSSSSGSYSGRSSSCACVRSCACACACAGGGRAGCSRKGFVVRFSHLRTVKEDGNETPVAVASFIARLGALRLRARQ